MTREPHHDDSRDSEAPRGAEFSTQAVLDGLSSHIAIVDSEGRIEFVNKAWRDFAEANPPVASNVCEGANYIEQCGKARGDGSEYAHIAAEAILDVLAGRVDTFTTEYPCHSPAARRWFSMCVTRYPGTGPARAIVAHDNITERKLAEEALRASEDRFRDLVRNLSSGVVVHDADTKVLLANEMASAVLGLSEEQMLGEAVDDPVWHLFREDGTRMPVEEYPVSQVVSSGMAVSGLTLGVCRPDLSELAWMVCNAYPVFDSGGNLRQVVVTFIDITQRKRAEEALALAAERDRHIADVLQQALIPPQTPMQPVGYEIAARYKPALREAEVCGDFYDLIDLGNGKIGAVIGDLVGKGLCAATGVAAVRQTIRSYALLGNGPSGVASLLNDALLRDTALQEDMLTAFLAVLDTRTDRLAYADAGHEPPLLRHSDGSVEPLAGAPGPILSGIGNQVFPKCEMALRTGDLVVLVTDGITEARMPHTLDFFGTEGIERCLARSAGDPVEQIATALLEDAAAFAGGELRDDAALVLIRKLGGPEGKDQPLPPDIAGEFGAGSREGCTDE